MQFVVINFDIKGCQKNKRESIKEEYKEKLKRGCNERSKTNIRFKIEEAFPFGYNPLNFIKSMDIDLIRDHLFPFEE